MSSWNPTVTVVDVIETKNSVILDKDGKPIPLITKQNPIGFIKLKERS